MKSTECISRRQLRKFNSGRLSEEQILTISVHLESCSECLAILNEISRCDAQPADEEAFAAELPSNAGDIAFARAMQSEEEPPPIPSMIGKYRVERLIANGGMAYVYLAIQPGLDRQVAIKVIKRRGQENDQAVRYFEREMKVMGRLSHPSIVQAFDVGEYDGLPFIVMDFVEGSNLAEVTKRDGPLSERTALSIVEQVGEVLDLLHQQDLVHGDVKPSNIVLQRDGSVKLIDFGLSRFIDSSKNSAPAGTPSFMAPEQTIDGKDVDQRADIYALGATFAYLTTGKTIPADVTALIRQLRMAGISPRVRRIIEKMVRPLPEERFSNLEETMREFARLGASRQTWASRMGALGLVATILLLAFFIGGYGRPQGTAVANRWQSSGQIPRFPGLVTSQANAKYPYQVQTLHPRKIEICRSRPHSDDVAVVDTTGTVWLGALIEGEFSPRQILPGKSGYYELDIEWSRDGEFLATAPAVNEPISIWDVDQGSRILIETREFNSVISCLDWTSIAPNILAVGDDRGLVRTYNANGELLQSFVASTAAITDIDWNSSRPSLVFGTKSGLLGKATKTERGYRVANLKQCEHAIQSIDWHPDGRKIAILLFQGGENQPVDIHVVDSANGTFETKNGLLGPTYGDVLWNVDGSVLAAIAQNTVVWNRNEENGREVFRPCSGCELDWRKKDLVFFDVPGVMIWNSETDSRTRVFKGESKAKSLSTSPDGERFAVSTLGEAVRMFNAEGRELWFDQVPNDSEGVWDLHWDPGGERIYGCSGTYLYAWNAKTGQRTTIDTKAPAVSISVRPNRSQLAVAGHQLTVWNTSDWKKLNELKLPDEYPNLRRIRFSPDGNTLLAGRYGGGIYVLRSDPSGTFTFQTTICQNVDPDFIRWNPNGEEFVVVDQDAQEILVTGIDGQVRHKPFDGRGKRRPGRPLWTSSNQILCGMVGPMDSRGGVLNFQSEVFRKNWVFETLDNGQTIVGGNWDGELRGFDAKTLTPKWMTALSRGSASISNTGEILHGDPDSIRYIIEPEAGRFETLELAEFEQRVLTKKGD